MDGGIHADPLGVVCYYALLTVYGGIQPCEPARLNLYWGVLWQSIFYAVASAFICLLLGYPMATTSPTEARPLRSFCTCW